MLFKLHSSKTRHSVKLIIFLFMFWALLSGKWDLFHLGIGMAAALFITWITLPLMRLTSRDGQRIFYAFDFPLFKYVKFWIWLVKEIIKANIEVAMIILNPKLPIDPQVVTLEKKFTNPIAQTTLSNAIILTPGTLTLDVDDNTYVIHSLTKKGAQRIERGFESKLIAKVDDVFQE
ncbi:Na+/H+ antiporter subunit E [Desulfuribacillus alkaliarsenatis]|uniref:Cation:proton antiporter n=1 Tax=Desulfuribacillus alkaliarsenatis TaxID=766136 RepID=A0A1E5G4A1_9FIRM|nr:Na+/H+ antiporter subunit E [Desulfuribacillus alkaliarsenatis]OEF97858.1 hypothetical protein BHF68_13605 [Desulfuribacillus alkaliarsenatis]